jgi:succinate dehydrogenase/fumarate reductase-like Fe-S protein
MTRDTATIRVQRGAPGEEPRLETYTVPYREGMSVLDALMWIRANRDSSLAIRYSCINANACKQCTLRVDGKVAYACTARLGGGTVTVEPLANKPLLRDLVTDTVPPKETLTHAVRAGEEPGA